MNDRATWDDPSFVSLSDVAQAPSPAGVSVMITRRQRAALAALGVSDDAIRAMTPAQAHARLGLVAGADGPPGTNLPVSNLD